ncbi:hypothetical protein ACFCYB_11775 [Streptomyces sp. NPDC056309]|uniref:hypothetical protein n=1 Tax=unclassified Streptomyces TaxID=2593676 RepID=UPI0035E0CB83
MGEAPGENRPKAASGGQNILVIGSDSRTSLGDAYGKNLMTTQSDTLMPAPAPRAKQSAAATVTMTIGPDMPALDAWREGRTGMRQASAPVPTRAFCNLAVSRLRRQRL